MALAQALALFPVLPQVQPQALPQALPQVQPQALPQVLKLVVTPVLVSVLVQVLALALPPSLGHPEHAAMFAGPVRSVRRASSSSNPHRSFPCLASCSAARGGTPAP